MAGRIPERFIDELLNRVDIVDVIGRRLQLKRAGREYQARCPFHDERTPSFTVSPSKQFYHCFGCGAHGSAIGFLMAYEGLEFVDAVEALAQEAGLEVPRDALRGPRDRGFEELYEALSAARDFFRQSLPREAAARAYLEHRGVAEAIVEQFELGWAPADGAGLIGALGPGRLAAAQKTGLVARGHYGPYGKFRERLMFPIHDRRGRVIAFGGRLIGPGEPKYLNSPESPVFHKGRELYGLYQARRHAEKLKRLVVVEGYLDVLALVQYQIPEVVATLGTATSREHAETLFRCADDVVFCFDGDRAGRQAAWRALGSVLPRLKDGRQAWFLFLPEGEDPDTLVRREGAAAFRRRLEQATPLSAYFFAELGRGIQIDTLDGRARLAERARPLLAQIPDGAFRDLMYAELERRTGARSVRPPRAPAPPVSTTRTPLRRSLVREAIALLLQQPQLGARLVPPYPFAGLDRPGVDLLIALLETIRARPEIGPSALLEAYAEHPAFPHLQRLALQDRPGDAAAQAREFADAIAQLEVQARRARITALQARADRLDADELAELRQLLERVRDPAG